MDYKEKVIALLNSQDLSKEQKEKLELIFPDLKESEDEKIRKELIDIVAKSSITFAFEDKNKVLAWLEKQGKQKNKINSCKITFEDVLALECAMKTIKITEGGNDLYEMLVRLYNKVHNAYLVEKQGEQKPILDFKAKDWYVSKVDGKIYNIHHSVDKVEPKFKVDDWIVGANSIYKITSLNDELNCYIVVTPNNEEVKIPYQFDDGQGHMCSYHLWTIADAKDGDILCTHECDEPKIVFILKGTPKKHYALSYHCYYNIMYPHFASDSEKGCLAPNDEDVKPATKEQRDLLFQKMHEASYEWDSEKKELRKIENRPLLSDFFNAEYERGKADVQKSTEWSENDSVRLQRIIDFLWYNRKGDTDTIYQQEQDIDWLKSLKQRIGG